MPNLESVTNIAGVYGPLVAIVAATFLTAETLFLAFMRRRVRVKAVNSRLDLLARTNDHQAALVELRRHRGLTADNRFQIPLAGISRLLMQSGLKVSADRMVLTMLGIGAATGGAAYFVSMPIVMCVLAGIVGGLLIPALIVGYLRSTRIKQLEEQLPETLDVLVRSLRAGHPIPVAIALVAREMPDPIGSEFGFVGDELTYGMDLTTALNNLRARAGQSDIAILVVAITIQSQTGGNLAELLANISKMVRERAKVRRKVVALSAEGRYSAIALSLIPIIMYFVIGMLSPDYYTSIADDPLTMPTVCIGVAMWVIGSLVMHRMVTFKV